VRDKYHGGVYYKRQRIEVPMRPLTGYQIKALYKELGLPRDDRIGIRFYPGHILATRDFDTTVGDSGDTYAAKYNEEKWPLQRIQDL